MSNLNEYQQAGEGSRTSVKVHHPPGGASNWSLGGDPEPAPAPQRRQAPAPAPVYQPAPAHPQQQTQVRSDAPHTSVKVHHAPGGASSFSLGDYKDPAPARQTQQPQPARGQMNAGTSIANANQSQFSLGGEPPAQPAKTSGSGVHTSVKVRHPPGGASSGFW